MAKSDFRFRVSKAVGSPSVQGAASMETIANHTEDPHPHPQYMRKSYVGLEFDLTQHLARRLDHANNYALRDEITTTKLEYEKYKLISLAHDASNYLSLTGVKPHLITSFVLNQILKDVGIDGSVKVLTYNNLINSYDTKVTDNTKYAPTWDIFLKLRNGIPSWIYGKNVGEFMLTATFEAWKTNVYNQFVISFNKYKESQVQDMADQWEDWKKEFIQYKKDVKDRWLKWVKYMYGEVASEDQRSEQYAHPVRPGLKVAMYTLPHRITKTLDLPRSSTDESLDLDQLDTSFEPDLSEDTFPEILTIHVKTSDVSRQPGKNYMKVVSDQLVELAENEGFLTNTSYYEELKFTLTKTQGDHLTTGCSILEKVLSANNPVFFDWYNGQNWKYWAGLCDNSEKYAFTPTMMVWHGHIKLQPGQTIRFRGFVDDWWYCKIGNSVITEDSNTGSKWRLWTTEELTSDPETGDPNPPTAFYSYTATEEDAIKDVIPVDPDEESDADDGDDAGDTGDGDDGDVAPEESEDETSDEEDSQDEEIRYELYEFTLAICNVHGTGPRVGLSITTDAVNWGKSQYPLRMSLDDGQSYIAVSNEGLEMPIFYLPDGSEEEWHIAEDLRDKHNYKPARRPGLLLSLWESNSVTVSSESSVRSIWSKYLRSPYAYQVHTEEGVTPPSTESVDYQELVMQIRRLHWDTSIYVGGRRTGRTFRDGTALKNYDGSSYATTSLWQHLESKPETYWWERRVQGPVITNGCNMADFATTIDRQYAFDWYNGLHWKYYCGTPHRAEYDPWNTRTIGWFGSILLRAGETVKFAGSVDDYASIKIGNTWLALDAFDMGGQLSNLSDYTATRTGFHDFVLLARNICTHGLIGKNSTNPSDKGLRMSINDGPWLKISNDSFDEPRFFLPDDCDHQRFWDQGIILRDKRAKTEAGHMVMSSRADRSAELQFRNNSSPDFTFKHNGNLTCSCWRYRVGYYYDTTASDWVERSDIPRGRGIFLVAVDVCIGASVSSSYDFQMWIHTPDDSQAYTYKSGGNDDEQYFGSYVALAHTAANEDSGTSTYRAVISTLLHVPKGTWVTFVANPVTNRSLTSLSIRHNLTKVYFAPLVDITGSPLPEQE